MPDSRNMLGCQVFHQDDLPEDWQCEPLGNRIRLRYGVGLKGENRIEGEYKVYGSNGIVGTHNEALVEGPGILIGRKGSVGAVHYSEEPFFPIDTVYFVERLRDDSFRYLFYLLDYLKLSRLNAATGVPGLTRKDALSMRGAFPQPHEQDDIANILGAVDEAIKRTRTTLEKAQRLSRWMMQKLTAYGINAKGEVRDPIVKSDFKDSLLGLIPREWSVRRLSEIADVDRGKFAHRPRNEPRFYGGKFPFVQTGDITRTKGGILQSYSQTLNEAGVAISREFPANTIAITIAANIADTAILEIPMYFPDSIVGAVVHSPHNTRFIEMCIRRAKPRLEARAPQSAQKNINLRDLRPLLIALPEPDEQDRIAMAYECFDSRVRAEEESYNSLFKLKHGLMQDLLSGKVRVKQLATAGSATD
jgi:type I restriction enzyme S subunit